MAGSSRWRTLLVTAGEFRRISRWDDLDYVLSSSATRQRCEKWHELSMIALCVGRVAKGALDPNIRRSAGSLAKYIELEPAWARTVASIPSMDGPFDGPTDEDLSAALAVGRESWKTLREMISQSGDTGSLGDGLDP